MQSSFLPVEVLDVRSLTGSFLILLQLLEVHHKNQTKSAAWGSQLVSENQQIITSVYSSSDLVSCEGYKCGHGALSLVHHSDDRSSANNIPSLKEYFIAKCLQNLPLAHTGWREPMVKLFRKRWWTGPPAVQRGRPGRDLGWSFGCAPRNVPHREP